jgi:hypothetical protein
MKLGKKIAGIGMFSVLAVGSLFGQSRYTPDHGRTQDSFAQHADQYQNRGQFNSRDRNFNQNFDRSFDRNRDSFREQSRFQYKPVYRRPIIRRDICY